MARELSEILESGEIGAVKLQNSGAEIQLEGDARRWGKISIPFYHLINSGHNSAKVAWSVAPGCPVAKMQEPGDAGDQTESLRFSFVIPADYTGNEIGSLLFKITWLDLSTGLSNDLRLLYNVMRQGQYLSSNTLHVFTIVDSGGIQPAIFQENSPASSSGDDDELSPGDIINCVFYRPSTSPTGTVYIHGLNVYYKKAGLGLASV